MEGRGMERRRHVVTETGRSSTLNGPAAATRAHQGLRALVIGPRALALSLQTIGI